MVSAEDFLKQATPKTAKPSAAEFLSAAPKAADMLKSNQGTMAPTDTSIERTVVNQGLQGATFGLSEEASAGLGSAGVKALDYVSRLFGGEGYGDVKDKTLGQLYDEALNIERRNIDAQQEERPALSALSQVGGALTTGLAATTPKVLGSGGSVGRAVGGAVNSVPGVKAARGAINAIPKAGQAAANSISSGGRIARTFKGAGAGATAGGVAGFGTGEGGLEERIDNAEDGAILGGVVGAAAPNVIDAVGGVAKQVGKAIKGGQKVTADYVKDLSRSAFKRADDVGGTFKPEITDKFVSSLDDIRPRTDMGRALAGTDDQATQYIERAQSFRGKPLTLESAQEMDSLLGKKASALFRSGKEDEAIDVLGIQDKLRSVIEDATDADIVGGGSKQGFEALKEARKLWAAGRRLEDIELIVNRAMSTKNPQTALQTGFKNLANNKKRLAGYTAEEKKLIQKAAKSGLLTDTVSLLGSRLNFIASLATGQTPGTVAAVQLGSTASRNVAGRMQLAKADRVAQSVINRAAIPQQALPAPTGTGKTLASILAAGNVKGGALPSN